MKLLAHITQKDGERVEQSLYEHCINTAEYASRSLTDIGLYNTAYLAGLLHDCGKSCVKFNQYLQDAFEGKEVCPGSVIHTFTGSVFILEKYHTDMSTKWEKLTSEIISYAIGAHHGLFDCVDLDGKNGFVYRLQKDRKELCYEEAVDNFLEYVADEKTIDDYFQKSVEEVREFFSKAIETYKDKKAWFQISLLTRMVLSAVINGDRRDTCEFMNQKEIFHYKQEDWSKMRQFFEGQISGFDSSTELNRIRKIISQQCCEAAEKLPGIYRLNVPTGGGKTLSALRYALTHAEKYHKKRIIFIIPLLSVLDQNVKVIRDFLPDSTCVLEHHSNVVCEIADKRDREELDHYELLTESWDAPVIVSTLVQLLHILFTHQTSSVRRMQALSDSVIVIDEVQSVPKKTVAMFNMALNFLQQHCNTTIILSSATQPCLDELKWPLRLAKKPDLVCLNAEQRKVFKRADILDFTTPYGMDWEECCEFCSGLMEVHSSLLIICNTKSEARILYEKLQSQAELETWDICHLSTAMCQKHRIEVLEIVHEKLVRIQKKETMRKLICVSTQLVEAGVDFSFDGVIRVLAGIDNLAQAAGRCNRSNEYGHLGKVYLINLKNENLSMLPDILNAQNSTRKVLEIIKKSQEESVIGDKLTRKFYQYLFLTPEAEKQIKYPVYQLNKKELSFYLADLWANYNRNARPETKKDYVLHQPFKTAGQEFKVFENNTIDVLVPYKEGEQLIERIRTIQNMYDQWDELNELIHQMKKYSVSIFQWQKEKLDKAGMLEYIQEGRILVLNKSAYDSCCGLVDSRELSVDYFIV